MRLQFNEKQIQLIFTSSSDYLIVDLKKQTYVYSLENQQQILKIENKDSEDHEFSDIQNYLYQILKDGSDLIIKIFDLKNEKQLHSFRQALNQFTVSEDAVIFSVQPVPPNMFIIRFSALVNENDDDDTNFSFLCNNNGKRLFYTLFYDYIFKNLGLSIEKIDTQIRFYKLYTINSGRLIRKIKLNDCRKRNPFSPADIVTNMVEFRGDLLIQTIDEIFPFYFAKDDGKRKESDFLTYEIRCLDYEIMKCSYKSFNEINDKRAYSLSKEGLVEFYYF